MDGRSLCVSGGRPSDRGQERGADGQDERGAADGGAGCERDRPFTLQLRV